MANEQHLNIPGDIARVPEVCEFVVATAEAAGLDEQAVYHCQMAVDEWCTNVIEHGCCDLPASEHQITVTCQEKTGEFVVTVIDDGFRFDPTTLAEVNPDKPLEERESGGLGWFFIRKLMDRVDYEFKDGRNHLTMIKRVPWLRPPPAEQSDNSIPVRQWNVYTWLVSPSGRLDANMAPRLEEVLTNQINAGHINLIVDMSAIAYISSSGLKILVTAWRKIQKRNGRILLACLSARVREVFQISGFDQLFTLSETVEEAALNIGPAVSGTD